jgi:hypothetical protein
MLSQALNISIDEICNNSLKNAKEFNNAKDLFHLLPVVTTSFIETSPKLIEKLNFENCKQWEVANDIAEGFCIEISKKSLSKVFGESAILYVDTKRIVNDFDTILALENQEHCYFARYICEGNDRYIKSILTEKIKLIDDNVAIVGVVVYKKVSIDL